jgi:hypothetical protein
MTARVFSVPNFTPTAVNDTTALTNGAHMSIGAGGALLGLKVKEISVAGLATVSTPNEMMFARNSTIAITPTALAAPNSDGPVSGFAQAPATAAKTFVAAATPPQRSAVTSAARLSLAHNAFGGGAKYQPYPGDEWTIFGITADISESSLSCLTNGGGAVEAHIIYENF